MADLVERLRAYLDGDKLHVLDSMLADAIKEAIDEIDGLQRDVAYEQSRADRLIDTMQQARLELSMLKARIEAAPSASDKTYKERCEDARKTDVGDVWKNIKTGKRVTVIGRRDFHVYLRHESGRETKKEDHYLASDYFLVVEE